MDIWPLTSWTSGRTSCGYLVASADRQGLALRNELEWASAESPATTLSLKDLPGHAGLRPGLGPDADGVFACAALTQAPLPRLPYGPDERGNSEWTLAGDRFTIEVGAPGFMQYLRRAPVLSDGPWLSVEERGGFSFAREGYG